MRRPDLIDLGIVSGAVALGLLTIPRHDPDFAVTLAFATVVATLAGVAVRAAVTAWVHSRQEQLRVRELGGLDREQVARAAVLAERVRLARDLDACIRQALVAVRDEVSAPSDDPLGVVRRVHAHARAASSELRRQLGLLRADEDVSSLPLHRSRSATPDGRDITVAALAVALAGAETALWGPTELADRFRWPWLPATMLAAGTVVGRRTHPALAALACTVIVGAAWALPQTHVISGLWQLPTLCGLLWALGTSWRWRHLLPALALVVVMTGSRMAEDPANATFVLVLLSVAWLVALAVGWNRRRHDRARVEAGLLEAELATAQATAVQAERLAVARELHDVVSHAVGVIAMQAAAAEVSWPADPEATLRAVGVIRQAAAEALAELDRVVPGAPGQPGGGLTALVGRIRATGTPVQFSQQGQVPAALAGVVHRVVQEGLTNAVRHAPGAAVDVTVRADAQQVRVRVSDDGPGPVGSNRGFGLAGLAERVGLLGGTVRSGPGERGGFVVDVALPVRTEARA